MLIRNAIQYGSGGPTPPVYDVLVHNTTELNLALDTYGAAGNVIIALDPAGTFTPGQTFTQNPASRIYIISASPTVRAPLPSIILSACSKISFEGIDHSENTKTGLCVTVAENTNAYDIYWDNSYFGGEEFDPNGDYSVNPPTARRGFDTIGTARFRGLWKITNSSCKFLQSCIKPAAMVEDNYFEGNDFDTFYDDGIHCGWAEAEPFNSFYACWNTFRRAVGLEADMNGTGEVGKGPHADAIQITTNADDDAIGPDNITIEGNRILGGGSRSEMAAFLARSTLTHIKNPKVCGNWRVTGDGFGDDSAPGVLDVQGAYVFGNLASGVNPGSGLSTTARVYTKTGAPKSFIGGNIANVIDTSGPKEVGTNVALANTLGAAQAQFDGPTFAPTTYDEIATKYKTKIGAPLDHLRDYVDFTARTLDRTLEPSFLGYDNFTGQLTGAVCTTPWRKLRGGGAGRTLVPGTGVEYRLADDAAGANPTSWGTTPGVVDEGRYVQARKTASGSGSTTVTATLTVGGWANSFDITTASVAVFSEIDNGGTAYSVRSGTPPNVAGNTWLILSTRFKHDTVGAGNQALLTQGSGSAMHIEMRGGTNYRVRLKSSLDLNASLAVVPDTTWHQIIVAIDLTQTDPLEVLKVYIDGSPVSTSGTPTIPITGLMTFNQNDFADLALMGNSAAAPGVSVFDGKMSYDYRHWGTGAIPFDIDDSAHRDRFSADLIDTGGAGYGPTGTQPKVYLNGNAAAYNAGIANAGSLGGTFAKTTGTYT